MHTNSIMLIVVALTIVCPLIVELRFSCRISPTSKTLAYHSVLIQTYVLIIVISELSTHRTWTGATFCEKVVDQSVGISTSGHSAIEAIAAIFALLKTG